MSNILKTDSSKPYLSDIYNGNYTLPVIYFAQENNDFEQMEKQELVTKIINNKVVINKTIDDVKEYSTRAIASLDFIEDNQYKVRLQELAEYLYKAE